MKTVFADSGFQPVTVGLNDEFLSVYEELPNSSKTYINALFEHGSPLRLLDGKYGNFCYRPGEFLAVSLAESYAAESYIGKKNASVRRIWIHLFNGNGVHDTFYYILANVNHTRDSYEKSSSSFARSVIKKISSCVSFSEAKQYLKNIGKSRYEKFVDDF